MCLGTKGRPNGLKLAAAQGNDVGAVEEGVHEGGDGGHNERPHPGGDGNGSRLPVIQYGE